MLVAGEDHVCGVHSGTVLSSLHLIRITAAKALNLETRSSRSRDWCEGAKRQELAVGDAHNAIHEHDRVAGHDALSQPVMAALLDLAVPVPKEEKVEG